MLNVEQGCCFAIISVIMCANRRNIRFAIRLLLCCCCAVAAETNVAIRSPRQKIKIQQELISFSMCVIKDFELRQIISVLYIHNECMLNDQLV